MVEIYLLFDSKEHSIHRKIKRVLRLSHGGVQSLCGTVTYGCFMVLFTKVLTKKKTFVKIWLKTTLQLMPCVDSSTAYGEITKIRIIKHWNCECVNVNGAIHNFFWR